MTDYIDRQAAIEIIQSMYPGMPRVPEMRKDWEKRYEPYIRMENAIRELPSAQPEQQWIPVKTRPMDSEEREYWEDQFGVKLEDEDAVMFDCRMPEDGQEILVSYRKWVNMDRCEIDGGCYGLEGNGDWEGVVAWMPLPEPYEEHSMEEFMYGQDPGDPEDGSL